MTPLCGHQGERSGGKLRETRSAVAAAVSRASVGDDERASDLDV
jgi:hypothetical protein